MSQLKKAADDEFIVAGRYKIVRLLDRGSFGVVYRARDLINGMEVAVKLESNQVNAPQLMYEAKIYEKVQGGTGIPKMLWYGFEKGFNVMVLDLLGPSLEDMLKFLTKFSMKTILMMADQMIRRVEHFHSMGFIHRDLKPANFLLGPGDNDHLIYLIDYGLAQSYYDCNRRRHVPYDTNVTMTGTVRYTSINSHLGMQPSRRDDLEALGYVFIYLLKGTLPWIGVKCANRTQKAEKIKEVKLSTSVATLCEGLPIEFTIFLRYCRDLKYAHVPNYMYLRQLLRWRFRKMRYEYDNDFDWVVLKRENRLRREAQAQSQQNN